MTAAIIIARGGSRRLPRKNVKPLCGHPLIAWSVAQARGASNIGLVTVATDDDEIAEVSIDYGADIVIRHPVWDESANRTFVFAVKYLLEERQDLDLDAIITMIPTCPLRLPGDLNRLIDNYFKVGAHSMAGMATATEMVVFRKLTPFSCRVESFSKRGDKMINTLGAAVRSPGYILNIDNHWADMSVKDLDKAIENGETGSELFYTETKAWQAQETDTAEDFELCELLMNHYILQGKTMEEVYGG